MRRAGQTWTKYQQLVGELAAQTGDAFVPGIVPDPREAGLAHEFRRAVRAEEPGAVARLEQYGLSARHYLHHVHYLALWGENRRRLLAQGGNFQLLEGLSAEEDRLAGLNFTHPLNRHQQQLAINAHLTPQLCDTAQRPGWLPPLEAADSRQPKRYRKDQVVWIYDQRELLDSEDLHPAVARSLIAEYMKAPGQVADPMAGSGTAVREARLQGHTVWASDKTPRDALTLAFDLYEHDLMDMMECRLDLDIGLVILHPPVPETLGDTLQTLGCTYDAWLLRILEHTWHVLANGGHLALVVSLETSADTVSQAEFALVHSYCRAFDIRLERPTASRLAVARDGRQGWHILIVKKELSDG
ncbi:MAG: hypothetical protein Q4C67_06550 [Deinococcus sp.]|nr:hypothetical protein [Deinococcus sp.]